MVDRQKHQATSKELRQFGLLVGGVFAAIGLWPVVFRGETSRIWAIVFGSLLLILGAIVPQALRQIHRGWMQVGHVLGSINTKIILGIIYYGLITPMGLVMRLMGKDSMRRALTKEATTYRVMRVPRPRQHMRNQF